MKLVDLTGKHFGRLIVIERAPNKGRKTMWLCACDCGNHITVESCNLKGGNTMSCGCLRRQTSALRQKIHGHSGERIYKEWCVIKRRCYNRNDISYRLYGERGIKMCDEWFSNFQSFYDWSMKNGYSDNLTIERMNSDGDYTPSNCKWATREEQNNNTSRNRSYTYNGETHTIAQWAAIKQMPYYVLQYRFQKGWGAEKALSTPVRKAK